MGQISKEQGSMLGVNRDTCQKKGSFKKCKISVWCPHASEVVVEVQGLTKNHELKEYSMGIRDGDKTVWESDIIAEIRKIDFKYRFRIKSNWNDCFKNEGDTLYRRDPYARDADFDSKWCYFYKKENFSYAARSIVPPEKWIIYELHLGTFTNGNTNESVFAAATKNLKHIKELGFTAIQLMPVTEFGGLWGYNPRTLFSVHSPYGTSHELKMLFNQAVRLGLAIIVDIVLNHGSSKKNELWAYDGYCKDNNGGIYFDKGEDTPWGKKFAFDTPHVQERIFFHAKVQRYLTDCCLMWAGLEYQVDAIRFDSAHNIPEWLLKNIIKEVRAIRPHIFLIAEVTPENPHYVHDVGFDACWIHATHFDARKLLHSLENFDCFIEIIGMFGWGHTTNGVRSLMGSHDQVGDRKNGGEDNGSHRFFVSRVGGRENWHARAKCRMFYALTAVSRGIPMIFQGTETLQDGWWHVDKPFLFQDDDIARAYKSLVKDANNMRVTTDAMTWNDLKIVHEDHINGVVGFLRGDGIFVVVHHGEQQWDNAEYRVNNPNSGKWKLMFNSQDEKYGGWKDSATEVVNFEHGGGNMNIPKWWVGVYSRE